MIRTDKHRGASRWLKILPGVLAVFMLGAVAAAQAADHEYDPDNDEEIMELCAGCHGEFGQGGGGGEYPRLAGLPAKYLAKQMRQFKDRTRDNMAMAPYATERELPEADLLDVSIYLSQLELPAQMPVIDPDLGSLEKLLLAQRVFNVPRLDGDAERGEEIYNGQCKRCHGPAGVGRGSTPQLAGQYSDYLRRQLVDFRSGKRPSRKMKKYAKPLSDADIEALLVYLSIADD